MKGLNPNGLDPLLTALGNYGGPTQVHMLKRGYDIGAVERQMGDSDLTPSLYLPLVVR